MDLVLQALSSGDKLQKFSILYFVNTSCGKFIINFSG